MFKVTGVVSDSPGERGSRALGSSWILLGLRKAGDILKKQGRRWGQGVLRNTERSTRALRSGEEAASLGCGGGGKVGGELR